MNNNYKNNVIQIDYTSFILYEFVIKKTLGKSSLCMPLYNVVHFI